MSALPDFFILGAPKSATTALASYLEGHIEIGLAEGESHYFATDFPGKRSANDQKGYEGLFESSRRNARCRGEKAVWYMYSREAVANIRKCNPNAKLIMLLRNPPEMLFSLHGQFLYDQTENEQDFEKAWGLCGARKAGQKIPNLCRARELLYYDEVARYGEQLERIYSIFPREQVRVFLFDDFAANPKIIYREVLNFLGVDDQKQPPELGSSPLYRDARSFLGVAEGESQQFPIVNPRKLVRSRFMQHVLFWAEHHTYHVRMEMQKKTGLDLRPLWDAFRPGFSTLLRWNTRQMKAAPPPREICWVIREHYRSDIQKLAQIVGRDLSHWLTT